MKNIWSQILVSQINLYRRHVCKHTQYHWSLCQLVMVNFNVIKHKHQWGSLSAGSGFQHTHSHARELPPNSLPAPVFSESFPTHTGTPASTHQIQWKQYTVSDCKWAVIFTAVLQLNRNLFDLEFHVKVKDFSHNTWQQVQVGHRFAMLTNRKHPLCKLCGANFASEFSLMLLVLLILVLPFKARYKHVTEGLNTEPSAHIPH